MSGFARREQLETEGRSLFAEKGFGATSVEEIAARAKVSKPVVYEHFGGKEGLYAVIIDRELTLIYSTIVNALESDPSPSAEVEHPALALLTNIEDNTDGFRIISSENDRSRGTYSTLLADVAVQVSGLFARQISEHGIYARFLPRTLQS